MMRCSCVILNYNEPVRSSNLARVLNSYDSVERVIIVDNCSPDGSWEKLQDLDGEEGIVLIKSNRNGGYGAGNNIGLRYCLDNPIEQERQLVVLCNPDTMISESALIETMECFAQNDNALVCAPWEYDANTDEPYVSTAWRLPSAGTYILQFLAVLGRLKRIDGYDFSELTERFCKVDCLSGALLMFDVRHFSQLGLYDEEVFLFCEEGGLGVRSHNRFDTFLCTQERYYHEFSTSLRTSLPNFRKRTGILSRSRKRVLLADYKVTGLAKLLTHVCYGISLVEAWPLGWAYRLYSMTKSDDE